jgi:serine/threonine protein kinase
MTMQGAIDAFRGNERFVVEGQLGEGGMGVVHRARDVERAEVVALKTMTRLDPGALLRFKREFRALADISHPNVVQLYELFSDGDFWFFTMELLDGCDFLTWASSSRSVPPPCFSESRMTTMPSAGAQPHRQETLVAPPGHDDPAMDLPPVSERQPAPAVRKRFAVRDEARLRGALRQLAAGVSAIHAAGKLHRDIKPSNVMVTREGRVVLLDFGVVGEYHPVHGADPGENPIVGTPAYMAPEQAKLHAPTPAADWYAVGVILFEALTARLPFEGETRHVLLAKQQPLAIRPSDVVDGVPADLERLCLDLLSIDPAARPTADEVLRRLEGEDMAAVSSSLDLPFVGRGAQLAQLHAAFAQSLSGPPVVVTLHGRSGMGKSALASRFLLEVASRYEAIVVSGRCYEREAVPFKAVDQVTDEICRWIARLPEDEAYAILPQDVQALAVLFPVLRNVAPVVDPPEPRADGRVGAASSGDRIELRRIAFAAMKELLCSIAARRPLVIHVDDLQWGDTDSVQLLESVLTSPAPRPLLLVCGHRSDATLPALDGKASGHALAAMEAARDRLGNSCVFREIEVGELSSAEAHELARVLVGDQDERLVAMIAAEARGSPLFMEELARWTREQSRVAPGGAVALEDVILARVARLPAEARALLETISVAGVPVSHAVAEGASGIVDRKRAAALALRGARLVSTRGLHDDDRIEPAHDRIRETVAGRLGDEALRDRHLALARALVDGRKADPEAAFEHFRAGGDDDGARRCALQAADVADRGLAFSRAADLYRAAIALGAGPRDTLYARLGDALANAGRGAEAADAYVEAAGHAPGRDAVELRRQAADHYLRSGRHDRGLEALRGSLRDVGLRYPESTEAAIASLAWGEARVRLSPLVRRVRGPHSVSARDLARIDVAFTAATGLANNDMLRSADFATRALLLALEAGEPLRLCRALTAASSSVAAAGEPGRCRAVRLVGAAERIAEQIDDPYSRACAMLGGAFVHFFLGEWRVARSKAAQAEPLLRTRCRGVQYELTMAQNIFCNVLILMGELREAALRVPGLLEDARARDDAFAITSLTYPASVALIKAADVEGAARVVRLVVQDGEFTFGQWGAFIAACSLDRYRGNGRAAWERVEQLSPVIDGSLLLRVALVRTCLAFERGLSAVAAASVGFERKRALRAADRYARDLSREKLSFGRAMGHLLSASAHAARDDRGGALEDLRAALPMLEVCDLGYLAACARHRQGELLGGATGRELVEQARRFFAAQDVRDVEGCLAMSAPGYRT